MSTRATMIDPERQMLGEVEMVGQDRWGGDPSSGGCGRIDSGDCSRAGRGPQDGAAMPAANGVETVPAGGAGRHATGHARGVSAAAGGRCRLLGSGSVSGAARSAVRSLGLKAIEHGYRVLFTTAAAMRFARDRAALLPLPPVPYEACDTRPTRVTSLSLVRYRRNDYSGANRLRPPRRGGEGLRGRRRDRLRE